MPGACCEWAKGNEGVQLESRDRRMCELTPITRSSAKGKEPPARNLGDLVAAGRLGCFWVRPKWLSRSVHNQAGD